MEPETSLARSMFAAVHSDFAGPPRTFVALDAKAIVTRLRKTPRLKVCSYSSRILLIIIVSIVRHLALARPIPRH